MFLPCQNNLIISIICVPSIIIRRDCLCGPMGHGPPRPTLDSPLSTGAVLMLGVEVECGHIGHSGVAVSSTYCNANVSAFFCALSVQLYRVACIINSMMTVECRVYRWLLFIATDCLFFIPHIDSLCGYYRHCESKNTPPNVCPYLSLIFSKFFHWHTLEKISDKTVIKDPTTP